MQFAESSSLWDRSFRPVQTHQEISAKGVALGESRRGSDETNALAFEQSYLTPGGGYFSWESLSQSTRSKLISVVLLSHL